MTRLYALKGRAAARPAAVMFFDLDLALAALPELGPRTRAAVVKLLPGALTLLLPNPAGRYPLACGPDPGRLGLRVPALAGALAPLAAAQWPVLQSSANRSGGADARRLDEVPGADPGRGGPAVGRRAAARLALDRGGPDGVRARGPPRGRPRGRRDEGSGGAIARRALAHYD